MSQTFVAAHPRLVLSRCESKVQSPIVSDRECVICVCKAAVLLYPPLALSLAHSQHHDASHLYLHQEDSVRSFVDDQ